MEQKFVFYIASNILNPDNFTDDKIKEFRDKILPILEIGRQLEAEVFYAFSDIQKIKETYDDIELNTLFSKSKANFLDVFLDGFRPVKLNNYFFEVLFAEENTSLKSTELPFYNSKNVSDCINIVFDLDEIGEKVYLLVLDNQNFEKVIVNRFNCEKEIWSFINSKLPKRKYNFSDKHGNNNVRAIAPKSENTSQLFCSDENAQGLLNDAIFDKRERNRFYVNFDEKLEKYILFPFEGNIPQNQFHAFHLDKEEWDIKIPKSIRRFFKR